MAVRNDLAPLPVVKTWAKRLSKALPVVSATNTPGLSVCQEAVARMLGHADWHALLKNYTDEPIQKDRVAETEGCKIMHDLQIMLQDIISKGNDAIYIEKTAESGHIKTRKGRLVQDYSIINPNDLDDMMQAFYNVVLENKDIYFQPTRIQSATMQGVWNDEPYQLFYKSNPTLPSGYKAVIDIYPVNLTPKTVKDSKSKNIQELCDLKHGIILLCSHGDAARRSMLSALGLALSQKGRVLVFSGRSLPQLRSVKNIVATPICYSDEHGKNTGWRIHDTSDTPYVGAVIDCFMMDGDWGHIDYVRRMVLGGPVFVSVDALNPYDALVQLDRLGHLRDLLHYGNLRGVAQASSAFSAKDNTPVESFTSLSPKTQTQLLETLPNEWESVLKQGNS